MRRVSRLWVPMTSLRELPGSSLGRRPTRASRGAVSSKIRPFDNAILMLAIGHIRRAFYLNDCFLTNPFYPGAKDAELLLDRLVAAVEVVDALDHRLALGHQPGDHQARGGPQVGGHDARPLQALHPAHHRGVALDR